MHIFSTIAGIALVVTVLWEVFETIVLPRRVTRQFRLTRLFYRSTWIPWTAITDLRSNKKKRDALLAFYGPLSLLLLLVFWAVTLIFGFALIHYGVSRFAGPLPSGRFGTALYMSGTTLFTLGLGDVTPATTLSRFITVVEAGLGFGFLALVIGYLPVLYQSFSRREVTISLLDARAGTPPTAYELLRRHAGPEGFDALTDVLKDWERWAAELMESHLSYPALAYFRSQHDNQSWLGSLVAVLDSCALAMVGLEGMCQYQARMTFAIARHALVDLSQVFSAAPAADVVLVRMSAEQLAELRRRLDQLGIRLSDHPGADGHLEELRRLYEPFAFSLARYLRIDLPPWFKSDPAKDNWQTSAWQPKQTERRAVASVDEHF